LTLSANGNLTVPDSIQLADNLALGGNNNDVEVDLSLATSVPNPAAGGVTIANNAALQGNNNSVDLSLATNLLNPTTGGVTFANNVALDGSNNSVNLILSTDNLNPSGTSGQFVANLGVEGNDTVVNLAPGRVSFTGNKSSASFTANNDKVNIAGSGDTVTITGSNDLVTVTGSHDTVTLAGSNDTVAFETAGFGNAHVNGFDPSQDAIQFNPALFANYMAVLSATQQSGPDTVVTYDSHDSVTLTGVTASGLTSNNFHFA
jgi:hypothetical protein